MKFSLVVATKNRVHEVDRFLRSLTTQVTTQVGENQDVTFEVILVDQNPDDRLSLVVHRYSPLFPLIHLKQETPGTSRARNRGIGLATGDIIAFPDDDCVYPAGFLIQVTDFFEAEPSWEGLAVRVRELAGDRDAFD